MKKVLYSLLIFISIFFVVDKVSAKIDNTNTIYHNLENSSFISLYNSLKPKLEEIVDYYKSNNPYNHHMVIYLNHSYIHVHLLPSAFDSSVGSNYCLYNNINRSSDVYVSLGCLAPSYNVKFYSFNSGSDISQFKSDMQTEFSSLSGLTANSTSGTALRPEATFSNNLHDFFSSRTYVRLPYYSTVPIYNNSSSSSNTYHKIKIGERELPVDGYLEPGNYFEEEEPEPNIFNEEIDDIDYSKMIFEFDVAVFKERGNIFDYLVEFHTLGTIQEDMTLNESHKQKFSRPYIEYVDENGVSRRLEIDFGYDEENELRNYWYVGNQDEISGSIQSLKLIIPMDKTAYARYSIELISFIPFTTYYVTNDEALSYYSNVDLTNKYGVVFMPKLIENNSDISSIFYTTGIESVLIYSSYDYKEQPVEIYDSNLSEFNYTISYENINYNLVFKVNSSTPNLGIVTYDTRYYTYKIIDSKYSLGNITNPNSGENHYVDFSNTANVKMDFDDIGDVFYFISEKIDSSGESYLLFKDSVSTFFNTMPTDIYILILTVLAVILIGTALALGGWK